MTTLTATTSAPATPTSARQWWVLSTRILRPMFLGPEWLMAVLSPVVFTVGFYLPLKYVMSVQGVDYGQFLMPIIVLQSVSFTATSAAFRAAQDAADGMNSRLKTLPMRAGIPLAARTSVNVVRLFLSLGAALLCGIPIGFHFQLGPAQSLGFCAFALLVGLALAVGADAIGTLSASPEMTSQALLLPQLILGMLSCGFVPITSFPDWIQPFVRNQPISLFSIALRDMTSGGITAAVFLPALWWALGLIAVAVPLSIWASVRRR